MYVHVTVYLSFATTIITREIDLELVKMGPGNIINISTVVELAYDFLTAVCVKSFCQRFCCDTLAVLTM
jgi:hypothetical protein